MKKLVLTLLMGSWMLLINAQTNAELNNKYWVYKDRFNQIFTQVGGEFGGQSQVSSGTGLTSCGSAYSKLVNGVEVPISENNPYPATINFGDAVIDHGWYLMVLASEYWILKQEGKENTDRFKSLKNQLYFAVNTIERLDKGAEPYFDQNQPETLNGFFIRTDADHTFLAQFNKNANDTGQVWQHQPLRRVSGGYHQGPEL